MCYLCDIELFELIKTQQKRVGLNSVNIQAGTGTAYEAIVSLPKPKGVKHGWSRHFGYLTGARFMIHPLANQKEQVLPACFASYSFDLRDVNFNVCPVTHDDVIHANKKDIDLIFKLSGSGIHRTTSGSNHVIYNELLIKAMTLSERKKDGGGVDAGLDVANTCKCQMAEFAFGTTKSNYYYERISRLSHLNHHHVKSGLTY